MRQLQRGDDTYRRLFGDEDLAVFVMGEAIEDCNPSACRLFGRSQDEIRGRTPLELSPLTQPDGTLSAEYGRRRTEAALGGLAQSFLWEFRRADGTPVETLVQLEAVRLDSKVRLFNYVRDISHLWQAEVSLKESETRLQQILNHTSTMVLAKDMEGRCLFANPAVERVIEVPVEQLIGQPVADYFPADVIARFERQDAQVLSEGRAVEVEEQELVRGELRTYLVNKFPLRNAHGEPYAVCGLGTDITERKRTEDALRQAALAMSSAGDASILDRLTQSLASILNVDVAFVSTMVPGSETRMRMLTCAIDGAQGPCEVYDLDDTPCCNVVGQAFRFIPRGLREQFKADATVQMLGLESYAGFPLNSPRGEPIGLVAVGSRRPLRNAGLCESILKIFAGRIAAEIERARTEEALRQSEVSYRTIFDESEDAIFVHDWDSGAIVDVNPKACESEGYSREEMLGVSVADISAGVPPFSAQEALRLLEQARSGPVRFEWRARHRSGRLAWKEICLKPARIAGVPRILAFSRDITSRKMAEEALRASEEQYRGIFNASLDGLVLRDARLRVVDVNPAFLAMNGITREELMGAEHLSYIAPEQRVLSAGRLQAALGGLSLHYESEGVRSDGTLFDTEVRVAPIRYQGQPHVLSIVRDITERKRIERERTQIEGRLRQAQKMEAIGQLTGGIAHDFNNILASIIGNIELAADRPASHNDAKVSNYLARAHRSCERARDLIQQMLLFSRGRRGDPRVVEFATMLPETVKLLRSTLPSSLELRAQVEPDTPSVLIDPVQVDQVLMNLCINARDATSASGHISIGVRGLTAHGLVCSACRNAATGRFVEVSVSDNGAGMKPEVLERIFEPFFTTKEIGKGTGMGLATVHGIVHESGGHVMVDSAPGRGTTFRVLLPMHEATTQAERPAKTVSPAKEERSPLAGHVLLVDDETMVSEFMVDLLSNWGLQVTTARDGAEAGELFVRERDRFDLVLTDQTMPRMSGLELARTLLKLRPELPVILYTGFADGLTDDQASAAGVRSVIRKPVAPNALFEVLRSHLG